jgi:hypothetical protein
MTKLISLLGFTVFLFSGTASLSASESRNTADSEADAIGVSMVRLLANPARYEGAVVDVTGYLDSAGTLFLTKDHADASDFPTGIQFFDQTKDGYIIRHCSGSYARVVGTFRMRRGEPVIGDDPGFYGFYDLRTVTTIKGGVANSCWRGKPVQAP